MSFDWRDYHTLAQQLAGLETSEASEEAKLRAAISRAYYAAHHLARDYLKNVDYDRNIPMTGDAHRYIIDKFENHNREDLRLVGKHLDRLRIERTHADYRDVFTKIQPRTEAALQKTATILRLLTSNR